MTRPFSALFLAGLTVAVSGICSAGESFPVVHNEPITVRIVGGKDGQPLSRLHLTLIAGYDRVDMREELYREEMLTDAHGQVRLPNQLANLPWLQVWVAKKSLCQEDAPKASFSVELIRRDGLSAPNHCGKVSVEDKPGVFTVFVKGKGAAPPAIARSPIPAPIPITIPAVIVPPPTAAPTTASTIVCCCPYPKAARRRRNARIRAKAALDDLGRCLRSNDSKGPSNKGR